MCLPKMAFKGSMVYTNPWRRIAIARRTVTSLRNQKYLKEYLSEVKTAGEICIPHQNIKIINKLCPGTK
ncbi:hypothetical protein GCM10027442_40700 [Emticicia fontis]